MRNLLLENVEYKIDETTHGVWRRFVYPSGELFAEYRTRAQVFGLPLLHYIRGRCPETGTRVMAKGFIAVGRIAVGVIALGQVSVGIIAFGQASVGLLFCLAQVGAGISAVGQVAVGILFGLGQFATGVTAVGQLALGKHVLAQVGFGEYLWTPGVADDAAVEHFQELWRWLTSWNSGVE